MCPAAKIIKNDGERIGDLNYVIVLIFLQKPCQTDIRELSLNTYVAEIIRYSRTAP